MRPAAPSIAARRSSPTEAPARTSAAAIPPSCGARRQMSAPKQPAAIAMTRTRRASASPRPAAAAAMATWYGRSPMAGAQGGPAGTRGAAAGARGSDAFTSRLKGLAQGLEALLSYPLHLPQLLQRAEAAVLRSVLHDSLGQRGA